jgi:hypothetical protein
MNQIMKIKFSGPDEPDGPDEQLNAKMLGISAKRGYEHIFCKPVFYQQKSSRDQFRKHAKKHTFIKTYVHKKWNH